MGYINFYLDKPFSSKVSKEEIKEIIQECNATSKPYPKSILNSRPNSIYLFFSNEKGYRSKIKLRSKLQACNGILITHATGLQFEAV